MATDVTREYARATKDLSAVVWKRSEVKGTLGELRGRQLTRYFEADTEELISQERTYLKLLTRRQDLLVSVCERLSEEKERSRSGRAETSIRPGNEEWREAESGCESCRWSTARGRRYDYLKGRACKGDAAQKFVETYWIAARTAQLEGVRDAMGAEAPRLLRNLVSDGKDLTWMLLSGQDDSEWVRCAPRVMKKGETKDETRRNVISANEIKQ